MLFVLQPMLCMYLDSATPQGSNLYETVHVHAGFVDLDTVSVSQESWTKIATISIILSAS